MGSSLAPQVISCADLRQDIYSLEGSETSCQTVESGLGLWVSALAAREAVQVYVCLPLLPASSRSTESESLGMRAENPYFFKNPVTLMQNVGNQWPRSALMSSSNLVYVIKSNITFQVETIPQNTFPLICLNLLCCFSFPYL